MKKNVVILGSTGSIGINSLEVLSLHSKDYNIYGLAADSSKDVLLNQCKEFKPKYIYLSDENDANDVNLKIKELGISTEVLFGKTELNNLASKSEVDIVICSISGSAGLESSISAVKSGKKILLANKESLVMCGRLFIDLAKKHKATILPVDSEHNALHQCFFNNENDTNVEKIILTASGGPLLNKDINSFDKISVEEALNHPTWSMGKKISIDSATMMNKGLEIIEAMHLFDLKSSQIEVIIHPQSLIHSMVCYCDGSIIAQASKNDMKIPISYCLGWPKRINSGISSLNFTSQAPFTFQEVSKERYPCFFLAKEVAKEGDSLPTAMNAANEEAVLAFIDKKIKFTDIYKIINDTLNTQEKIRLKSLEDVIDVDQNSRNSAKKLVESYN